MIGLLLVAPGCSSGKADATLDGMVKSLFTPKRTPQQQMLVAVSDSDADLRRNAIAKVATSKQKRADWAVKGMVAIALLESDSQTRCVAVRGLAEGNDPRAVETFLKILNYKEFPPQEVRPPDDVCRWDAILGLCTCISRGRVSEDQKPDVQEVLQNAIKRDPFWHARAAAAGGLANFQEVDAIKALIGGLRDENFTVAYESDRALVRATGVTQGGSLLGWDEWFKANEGNLFARHGQTPPGAEPPYRNSFQKLGYDTRQFMWWLFPGKKA